MDKRVTVFVADDHLAFLEELKTLIARNECVRLVGEATDGTMAWERIKALSPELVLLDINMPGLGGLEVLERINRASLDINVVLVTSYKEKSLFDEAMALGVKGYVLKDDYVTDLPSALCSMSQGEPFVSPALLPFLGKGECDPNQGRLGRDGLEHLTPQELRILRLLADELNDRKISKQLVLSPEDITRLRERIRVKLELLDDRELLDFARRHRAELKGFKLVPQDTE